MIPKLLLLLLVIVATTVPANSRSSYGFTVAHLRVSVDCFKPELVSLLKKIGKHYGKKVVVTSGYRSPAHNRRVRGAKRSLHMRCKAADIKVPGVSKSALAKYVRSIPGRGGVGLYCRSSAIHVDIGTKRQWYWGCGKRKRRKA
jgi:uncharacterized protein YcbK (DUF882 family)